MEYNFYSHQDSVGHDLTRLPPEECRDFCDSEPSAIAYNTLGYIKTSIAPPDQWITTNWNQPDSEGFYIKKEYDPVQKAIDRIVDYQGEKLPITFTITTCKRLNYFIRAMNTFLVRCQDAHLFQEWICVDDNSTPEDREKMRARFPFFKFIMKTPAEKGHAKSMNMILDTVHTDFILHYEDDWFVHTNFSVAALMIWLQGQSYTQLILRKIDRQNNNIVGNLGAPVHLYTANFHHYIKPSINRKLDELYNISPPVEDTRKDWWWPGLSLNPSIIKINELKQHVGHFNEAIIPELFEYEYALRYYMKGMESAYINLPIHHIGETSSYVLNGEFRSHD